MANYAENEVDFVVLVGVETKVLGGSDEKNWQPFEDQYHFGEMAHLTASSVRLSCEVSNLNAKRCWFNVLLIRPACWSILCISVHEESCFLRFY